MDLQINIKEAKQRTLINIDINDAENVKSFVALLRSLSFIKKVEIVGDNNLEETTPKSSRFARYYGAAKTGLSEVELDSKISEIRNVCNLQF